MSAFSGEVHPAAAVWPMLEEDDLRRLAEDIAANGLRHPVVLDADGRVLDGRNRLAACRIAGVDPTFETYKGDPIALVLSENNERRHMGTGQRAMATALTLAELGKRRNGRWARGAVPDSGGTANTSWQARIKEAGVILDYAPELADAVVAGEKKLNYAYEVACDVRDRKARLAELGEELSTLVDNGLIDIDEAERRADHNNRYAALPADLQQRVDDGLDIGEAEAVVRERRERIRIHVESIARALTVLARLAGNPLPDGYADALAEQGVDNNALSVALKALEEAGYGTE